MDYRNFLFVSIRCTLTTNFYFVYFYSMFFIFFIHYVHMDYHNFNLI
jgi:hypothetical protein